MIKLVSFLVFLGGFVWTWSLFHSKSTINVAVHAGLQSKLAIMIEETIKNSKPNSSDFKILSLYTQTVDANKVVAHYSYKFNDKNESQESSTQTISGEATLNRTPSENPEDEKWIVQAVKSTSSSVEFQEGSIIGPETPVEQAAASENASGDATAAVTNPENAKPVDGTSTTNKEASPSNNEPKAHQ